MGCCSSCEEDKKSSSKNNHSPHEDIEAKELQIKQQNEPFLNSNDENIRC